MSTEEIVIGDTVEWSPQAHKPLRGEVMVLCRAGQSPYAAALNTLGCALAELNINGWRGIESRSHGRDQAVAIVRVVKKSPKTGKDLAPRYYIPEQHKLKKVQP